MTSSSLFIYQVISFVKCLFDLVSPVLLLQLFDIVKCNLAIIILQVDVSAGATQEQFDQVDLETPVFLLACNDEWSVAYDVISVVASQGLRFLIQW